MPTLANQHRKTKQRRGSSTLSATVALLLVTVAASLNVPPWLRAREQATADEAIRYLTDVHGAQEKFRERNGSYADDIDLLDLSYLPPTYFCVGRLAEVNGHQIDGPQRGESWSLTLTRYSGQTVFSPYSITCTQGGFLRIQGKKAGPLVGLRPKIGR